MTYLVTGAAGFIGSHLSESLIRRGKKVIGIDCFSPYYPRKIKEENIRSLCHEKDFRFLEADLYEIDLKEIIGDVDYILHLAAQPGVRGSWGRRFQDYVKNNIEVTQRLLETVKDVGIKKLIYASSSSVYGDCSLPMIEDDTALHPVSPYGVTKLSAESLCYLYWKNFSLPVVSIRYFTVYGERQRPDMAFFRFIKAIIQDEPISVFGDGSQTRDFTYIGDAVDGTLLALEYGEPGEVFNIGGGERTSIRDSIDIIARIAGKEAKVRHLDTEKGDVRDTYADITKARERIGYCPKISLREGLKRQFNWIKEATGEKDDIEGAD
jgi:UDP-glucose 4-epimerase